MGKKNKIILTMVYDIKLFPPVISICNILSNLNYEIVYIGGCTDENIEKSLVSDCNVRFYKVPPYGGNALVRLIQQYKYREFVLNILKQEYNKENTYLWLLHSETVSLFASLLGKYDVIAHLFEFKNPRQKLAYRLLSPLAPFDKKLKLATKVICCEYNRAHLTKVIYGLDRLPFILPNKPYLPKQNPITPLGLALPSEVEENLLKYKDKKIILYQGIFIPERKVEYFIESIKFLPDDYVLFLMGGKNALYDELKDKYENERVVFFPFLPPPLHLKVTSLAHIGILVYVVNNVPINHAINVSYCAPNKLYEYSMFGIPMITNDLPALRMAFLENKAGICVNNMEPVSISNAILKLEDNYSEYSENAVALYESVDMVGLIQNILS